MNIYKVTTIRYKEHTQGICTKKYTRNIHKEYWQEIYTRNIQQIDKKNMHKEYIQEL